jgi:hypothetical protein
MARHFSVTLDDLFKMDNSIADLDAAVDQKYAPLSLVTLDRHFTAETFTNTTSRKRLVSTHTSELKALEEALRATEERLKATAAGNDRAPSPRSRKAINDNTFDKPQDESTLNATTLAERPKTASRPGTARKPAPSPTQNKNLPPMPGARPPTPGASESEEESEESDESDESKE